MSTSTPNPVPPRKRIVWTVLWLAAMTLLWGGLFMIARRSEKGGAFMMGFLVAIVLTYLLTWGWAIAISRTRRLTVFRGLRTTLMMLIILVCLELPAAFHLVHWGMLFQRLTGNLDYFNSAFVQDHDLAFRRKPNEHWSGQPVSGSDTGWSRPSAPSEPIHFTTDRWGYRNATDLERADIALIGDSFVEGYHVSDEHTSARVLQERLGRPVANLGVAGYGPMQELIVLKQEGGRLKPAVVVWFFFEGNDLYDDENFEAFQMDPSGKRGDMVQQTWPRRSFTLNALGLLRPWIKAIRPAYPYVGQLSRPGQQDQTVEFLDAAASIPWTEHEAFCWKRSQKVVEEGADFCRKHDIHLLMCYVPMQFPVYRPFVTLPPDSPCKDWKEWPLQRMFADFCGSADIPNLDLTEVLQEQLRQGHIPYTAGDTHWNPEGHAAVADRVAQEIRKRGWLPAN